MNSYGMKILVVDDEQDYCNVMKMILSSRGDAVDAVGSGLEAVSYLKHTYCDLVITDLLMPEMSGGELLKEVKKINRATEVIVLTAYGSIKTAVEVMKDGAYTYVTKGESPEELIIEVDRLREVIKLKAENKALKKSAHNLDYMLETKSDAYSRVLNVALKAAKSDLDVMLLGESGVGKEVVARYIYANSSRKNRIFMDLNCYSIAESVFESELFGHEKGSFTGAGHKRIGRIEASDKGTLFLDEIGDIPLSMQAKLLKAVEEKKVYRMGSNEPVHLDFRIISATNKDIEQEIEAGRFRSDLYYRLNSITLKIPPLRERSEDLPLLIDHFMKKARAEMKKEIVRIEPGVMEFLLCYEYPGNIRELKNIIERLVALSEDGRVSLDSVQGDNYPLKGLPPHAASKSLREMRKEFEAKYIGDLLDVHGNDLDKAADALEITKRQLFNKINEFGLKKDKAEQ